jgi:predicted nucleic acid-binding protein
MRIALDTNLLVYAEAVPGDPRSRQMHTWLARLPTADVVLPLQVLGELHRVLVQKVRWERSQAQSAVDDWMASYESAPASAETFQAALQMSSDHQVSTWDAIILAVAAQERCRYLLSEDYQHGFAWRSTRVVNPFSADLPHDIAALLHG